MDTLGSRIRFLRGKLSQGAFAARIGVSKASLGGYERDVNLPNTDVALEICRQADVSVSWLLTGKNDDSAGGPAFSSQDAARAVVDEISALPGAVDVAPACRRCQRLEEKLDRLDDERRELNRENRHLWQVNNEMAVRLARAESGTVV